MKSIFFYFTIAAALLTSCARQGAPTGGPEDTTPPQVDTTASTRNFSTRFDKKRIELKFDEWVVLSDVAAQVVVSPPLKTKRTPDVTLKGKTVIVEIPEKDTLRPNTTYTINFGTAVKDFHKGNPAKDLRFVFSTGDFIDSLSVKGGVLDAFSGEPVENISVMLYDGTQDSIVKKEKPYYFSKTDKTGQFLFQNVKSGRFKCTAIEDLDQNLKWTSENERIGFPDSVLNVIDSARSLVTIKLFKDFSKLRLLDKNANRYGQLKLTYNGKPDTVHFQTDAIGLRYLLEPLQDTLFVWYDQPETTAWKWTSGKDTLSVKKLSREDFLKNHKPVLAGDSRPVQGGKAPKRAAAAPAPVPAAAQAPIVINQNPIKPAVLLFNYPMVAVDTSKWQLLLDSTPVRAFQAMTDSVKIRSINLQTTWKQGKTYKLTLFPGAVTDFYGVTNTDTIKRSFNVFTEKVLGGLNLTVKKLVPGKHYVLQLISGQDQVELERAFEADGAEKRFVFTNLPTAQYTVRLIEDRNQNRVWDTGNYFAHRQPESITLKKLDALRANWEIEATLEVGGVDKPKVKK
ncbi:MAG: Ig-like domain-containing protein [Bacteroidota bacterium]